MASQATDLSQIPLPITRPSFDHEEIAAVQAVLDSGWVTQGPMTAAFEKAFAERHQVSRTLATTSCTAALHMSALALGIGPGDEVIVPSFTWVTSAHCAEYTGAKAVFCDIDPATFNMSPDAVAAAVTPRTKAIVAVHLFGLAADLYALKHIAQRHGLAIIEDAACAVGSTYFGKAVGSFGDLGCFSFHPRKVITTGEGGMVTTESKDLADRVAALRNHGSNRLKTPAAPQPHHMGAFEFLGFNLRLSDIQAAIGLAQMKKLDGLLEHRWACALGYNQLLKDIEWLRLPAEPEGYRHTYQSYVVWVKPESPLPRNHIMEHLAAHGIQTRPGTMAVHLTPYYRDKYGIAADSLAWSKAAEECTITLPIFPGMQERDLERVAGALRCVEQSARTLRKAG
ncbi:MAG: DegT/DnrJ/EryC1/StrS family aminotransferase [Gemmataceae bacterium]|nr:DegT/DnrJ/EryC1/StrS family aminotransferase [Gemmataceae bacterium]